MGSDIPSYPLKVYTVVDNQALIRDPRNIQRAIRYKPGDVLPPGKEVGDRKTIPMMTKIRVAGVRTDESRNVFVLAELADDSAPLPVGWTSATNMDGQFLNELVGYAPAEWDLPPLGDNYTVTDSLSLVRNGPPRYRSRGSTIPVGTYVVVTARSRDTNPEGKYVSVSRGEIEDGAISAVEPIGWTLFTNLTAGWSEVFTTEAWTSETGPNACWRRGKYIGAKILVNIVGTGNQMEQLTLDSLPAYVDLRAAAKKDCIVLGIVSGFRTYEKQKRLYDLYLRGEGNLAARPGYSNHQHGQALDLNTDGFDGTTVYDWLKRNGPKFGFIRTVNGEHWHWEYRPDEAAELAAEGRYKLRSVTR